MRRFRVVRGGVDDSHPVPTNPDDSPPDPALTRRLRGLYAPPSDGYWDGFEATIMAAVRASRAAPATAVSWWHTLAGWARPGLAAAAVVIGVVGGVLLQTEGARSDARSVLDLPAATIAPLDEDLARVIDDSWADSLSPSARREARATSDLLTDGVKRRPRAQLDLDETQALVTDGAERMRVHDRAQERAHERAQDSIRSRREATFRAVIP